MSRKRILMGILVVALLAAGVLIVYTPQLPPWLGGKADLHAANEFTFISDLDFWQRTPRERTVAATAHFDLNHNLNSVPMNVGSWVGENAPETNQEVMILLDPEQYVQRLYHDDAGHQLWLTMVGGRSSQPFHAPDICYDADGWQYNLGSHATSLPGGGEIYGLYLDATKPDPKSSTPFNHVVYYFYLFPDNKRDQSNGIVLFKLTSGKYGTLEDTLKIQEDFTRQFFRAAAPGELAEAH